MLVTAIAIASGILVGFSLGLTGSGGSLFAIPLLLFVVGMEMQDAVPISMLVVGVTALLGALSAFNNHLLIARPTLVFGVAGILFAPLGLKLGMVTPELIRVLGFAALAIVMGLRMAWQSRYSETARMVRAGPELEGSAGVCRFSPDGEMRFSVPCALVLFAAGAIVGVLSGFFGVGGGFLIVPVLMYVIRMDLQYAVGSSLAIIAMIGITGGAINAISIVIAQPSALLFGVGSMLGMLLGRAVSSYLAGPVLYRIFAIALIVTGVFMIGRIIGGSNAL